MRKHWPRSTPRDQINWSMAGSELEPRGAGSRIGLLTIMAGWLSQVKRLTVVIYNCIQTNPRQLLRANLRTTLYLSYLTSLSHHWEAQRFRFEDPQAGGFNQGLGGFKTRVLSIPQDCVVMVTRSNYRGVLTPQKSFSLGYICTEKCYENTHN